MEFMTERNEGRVSVQHVGCGEKISDDMFLGKPQLVLGAVLVDANPQIQ